MAEDDSGVSQFIESIIDGSEIDGVDFQAVDSVSWSRLGTGIVAGIISALAIGLNAIVQGVFAAYTSILDGIAAFIDGGTVSVDGVSFVTRPGDGLFDVTVGAGLAAIRGAWAFSVSQFGVLALPIAIGVMLTTFYILSQGISTARRVV